MANVIKKDYGWGGAQLTSGAAGSPPLAEVLRGIADDLAARSGIATGDLGETNGVVDGLITGDPTTPSVQSVDPGGETSWHVNISAGFAFVNAVGKYNAAQVDVDVSTGTKIMEIGESIYAWIVWKESGGTVSQQVVLGTAAIDSAETIPSDGDITTAVGHARWIKLALCHAHRHADAVVQCTQTVASMKKWGGAAATLVNEIKAALNTSLNTVKG